MDSLIETRGHTNSQILIFIVSTTTSSNGNIILSGGLLNLLLVSEYKAYDVENGFEFYLDGTVVTREQIREDIT